MSQQSAPAISYHQAQTPLSPALQRELYSLAVTVLTPLIPSQFLPLLQGSLPAILRNETEESVYHRLKTMRDQLGQGLELILQERVERLKGQPETNPAGV